MPGKAEMKLGLNRALIESGISLKLPCFLAYRAPAQSRCVVVAKSRAAYVPFKLSNGTVLSDLFFALE